MGPGLRIGKKASGYVEKTFDLCVIGKEVQSTQGKQQQVGFLVY
jgi:hypothetical protein